MDKMVEIARFQHPTKAQVLVALLKSEEIDCYIRNEVITQVFGNIDVGGVHVEILESDIPHALEVMKVGGYEIPNEDEDASQIQTVVKWVNRVPFLRKYSLSTQIFILFVLIAICLGLLIFFGTLPATVLN